MVPASRRSSALAVTVAVLLLGTACSNDVVDGTDKLDHAQCELLRDQESLLVSTVGDQWQAAIDHPVATLGDVQVVVRNVIRIADDHRDESNVATFTSITDAFLAYQLRADTYIDDPPAPDDPVESGRHAQLRDNLTWAMERGCAS